MEILDEKIIDNDFVNKYKGEQFIIVFKSGISLPINSKGKLMHIKKIKASFFISPSNGKICFKVGKMRHKGFYLDHPQYANMNNYIENIFVCKNSKGIKSNNDFKANAELIIKKCHPEFREYWEKSLAKTLKDGELHSNWFLDHMKIRHISYFIKNKYERESVIEELKNAIDNKKTFSYIDSANSTRGRDIKITTEFVGDYFRGFVNSEFHNCGNGDYYVLLNHKDVLFLERD